MNALRQLLTRVRRAGTRRPGAVRTVAMGRERSFRAWDVGEDTFIFEDGVRLHLDEHPSVLLADKRDLSRRARGRVMTVTTGNHSVAALPLLDGRFWKLSTLPAAKRGETLLHSILCANAVDGKVEISQRDVPVEKLFAADGWLLGRGGFRLDEVVMGDRNDQALERYRELGQEWRVKPLAWTETEMRTALAASRKRIATSLVYYHSSRGVHFLSLSEFRRFAALAATDYAAFVAGMREIVSVFEGNRTSFARMVKHRGHHEVELFGVRRGEALERLIPEMERLMEAIVLGRADQSAAARRIGEIVALFEASLSRAEYADENSKAFVEALYMHITGEVYAVVGDGATPAFDDRRTAIPGATFVDGRPVFHPGCDERSEVLLSNLRGLMSKDEVVLYANVYELREEDEAEKVGCGRTREIVFRTNRMPLEQALVEKKLSSSRRGYGSYMFARVGALRALGVQLSDFYRLLRRRGLKGRRAIDFYIRRRCEGEPIDAIPATYFATADDATVEDRSVVLALAALLGDAAAQNMAMKKFDPATESPLFGVGKEIYEFEYDLTRERVVPKRVATCSVRGSFGWPDLRHEDGNLHAMAGFYFTHYALALREFQRRHRVPLEELEARFMDGFSFRTHAMAWHLSVMRDQFESFDPGLPAAYAFVRKWRFVMWSLERQERRLPSLKALLHEKLALNVERQVAT